MKKHAFLIMAHGHWQLLNTLLSLLDDERVDIYLHVDRKAHVPDPAPWQGILQKASLFLIPRRRIRWGTESQILCELDLIGAALKGDYQHYHLLSGVDLPIKPIGEILAFFDRYPDREFVHFDAPETAPLNLDRVRYYYPGPLCSRRPFWSAVRFPAVRLQKKLGVCRHRKNPIHYGKGANWFSCTHAFLADLWRHEKEIRRFFRHSFCCDEIFLQTYLLSSPFRDDLYDRSFSDSPLSNMRLIDWKRGAPYTFRAEDVPELLRSPCLFARKFDEILYPDAVEAVYCALTGSSDKEL